MHYSIKGTDDKEKVQTPPALGPSILTKHHELFNESKSAFLLYLVAYV